MICQDCGVEAATKHVSFHQNIGAFIVHFPSSIKGRLCKSCIHKHFWKMTGTTFFLGWWGTISFCITPFFLLNNIGRYLFCVGMPPVLPDATAPRLTDDAVDRISPHTSELFSRINGGEEFETVVKLIAEKAEVTPGQIVLYIQAVIQAQSRENN